ncbi:MAG: DUF5681 domain-containing protein [Alphaproteobacteria bacterium]|nr:DUF5681 domain-containing protein [Alphaproteobacteria bacterium]
MDDDTEDKVGFCRPPKATRFKPGQSGNPTGRPRGSKNTYKLLDGILNQNVQVTQDGKPIRISKKAAVLLQAVNTAVKGDIKSIQTLFPHMLAVDAKSEEHENRRDALSTDEKEILKDFLKEHGHG